MRTGKLFWGASILLSLSFYGMPQLGHTHSTGTSGPNFVHIDAHTPQQRTTLANMGVSIESVLSDSVYGTATNSVMERLRKSPFKILETFRLQDVARVLDFPSADSRYHNYDELVTAIDEVVNAHSSFMRKFSIGKTVQGRDIWAVEVNPSLRTRDDEEAVSGKPGIVFMGNHHAREHLSAEIPLMLLQYLGQNYQQDVEVTRLVDTRDIFIIPMVNPDGVEYDIADGDYKMHRKNMRDNGDGTVGVDLNRNYGFMWGTGGSSNDTSSDVYMGPTPFSEPESQAVKAFVEGHPNLKILLSYHTFSELILYPWGHKYEAIDDQRDHTTYETMARQMAHWNHYTPQQSSQLYIASGDTTDWAWGERHIFSFTFELSPKNMWSGGGFYPGAGIIDQVFADNLRPALYLIDLADDPYRAHESDGSDDTRLMWLMQ